MKDFIRALACAGLLHVTLAGADPLPATPADVAGAPHATAAQADTRAPVADQPPASAPADAPAPGRPVAQVEQPRAWGHSVGDVLRQRVLLQAQGRELALTRLPDPGRIGVWLERRPARIDMDSDGRRWLQFDYQLINAPQALTTLALPALELSTGAGVLQVPAWPISVAPLSPRNAFAEGALHALQPDRAAPAIDTAPLRRLDADTAEAWQTLHRAFDRSAGASLQAASLHRLFERAPQFVPLRAEIERFYAASAARFFGDRATASATAAGTSPRALAQALARIERRHES